MIGVAKAPPTALVKVEPEPEQGAEPEPAAESDTFDLSTLLEIEKAEGPEGEGDDPMLVIKAGAKMRKARLTQFEQAVTVLQGILSELKGIPAAGGTEKVSKDEGASVVATVATMLDGIKTSMAARLAGIQKAVDGVVARVERIESVRPEGNGAVDPTPIKKADPNDDSNPDFWSGVL